MMVLKANTKECITLTCHARSRSPVIYSDRQLLVGGG